MSVRSDGIAVSRTTSRYERRCNTRWKRYFDRHGAAWILDWRQAASLGHRAQVRARVGAITEFAVNVGAPGVEMSVGPNGISILVRTRDGCWCDSRGQRHHYWGVATIGSAISELAGSVGAPGVEMSVRSDGVCGPSSGGDGLRGDSCRESHLYRCRGAGHRTTPIVTTTRTGVRAVTEFAFPVVTPGVKAVVRADGVAATRKRKAGTLPRCYCSRAHPSW